MFKIWHEGRIRTEQDSIVTLTSRPSELRYTPSGSSNASLHPKKNSSKFGMREELELSKIVFNLKQLQSNTVQEFVITVVNQTIVQSKKIP